MRERRSPFQALRPTERPYPMRFPRSSTDRRGREGQSQSVTREGQPERGHFLAVANQQDVADQHRVVPGLAIERREPCDLGELIRVRADQRQLTVLRRHQQQVLIGEQNELAVAVAPALPRALAILEVDAGEDVAVEAEGMALVNDE